MKLCISEAPRVCVFMCVYLNNYYCFLEHLQQFVEGFKVVAVLQQGG